MSKNICKKDAWYARGFLHGQKSRKKEVLELLNKPCEECGGNCIDLEDLVKKIKRL